MAENKRKRVYIDRNVQGVLARRLILHWCAFIVVGCVVTVMLQLLMDPFGSFRANLQTAWYMFGPFAVVAVFLAPVFVRDSITLSHRFVGPVSRLQTLLKKVASGEDVEAMRIRPDDFWGELAKDFNGVLNRIHQLERKSAADVADKETEELANV